MDKVEIVVKVFKDYVQDAEDFGMLDSDTIAQVLRDECIMKFVDLEVKAHRAEKRSTRLHNQED
jgi:hypothetical protein